jgi:hypothetical protein
MSQSVLKQIAQLGRLSLPQLEERWRSLFGKAPPAYHRRFLIKRLAYRIQELVYGGLSEEAKARMADIAQEAGLDEDASITGRGGRPKRKQELPVAGTRLVREWNGGRYEVTVAAGGFEFEGKPYRSLTAITKAITGTHWNGRAFFGLRPPGNGRNGR